MKEKFQKYGLSVGLGAAVVVVLVVVVGVIYFVRKYQRAQDLLSNPSLATQEEVASTVAKVGKLIVLPSGEAPTLYTVADKTKLAGQPFFQHAENGDKVLIYSQAQKVILYRDSINKIIEVASISVGGTPAVSSSARPKSSPENATPSATLEPSPSVAPPSVVPSARPTATP